MNESKTTIGKTYHFDSAHFLPDHDKCGVLHGHTWTLTIELTGKPNNVGFVVDFHVLNKIVNKVIEPLDHAVLNTFVERPTCENLAWYVKLQVWEGLNKCGLPFGLEHIKVILQEGGGGYAVVGGDDASK